MKQLAFACLSTALLVAYPASAQVIEGWDTDGDNTLSKSDRASETKLWLHQIPAYQ